jgi:hypothetical protein
MTSNNMTDNALGVASLPTYDDLPNPDDDYPDLTIGDSSDPTKFEKPDGKKGASAEVPQYILGTLVVRVVAARDLEVRGFLKGRGLLSFFFGLPNSRCLFCFVYVRSPFKWVDSVKWSLVATDRVSRIIEILGGPPTHTRA